jgi:hypothetical protein
VLYVVRFFLGTFFCGVGELDMVKINSSWKKGFHKCTLEGAVRLQKWDHVCGRHFR